MTTTYELRRYTDGQVIGTCSLTPSQLRVYNTQAQQPEGLVRLGSLPHSFYDLTEEFQDSSPDTTVYIY